MIFIIRDDISDSYIGPFDSQEDAVHYAESMELELNESSTLSVETLTSPSDWYETNVLSSEQTIRQEI